MRLYRDPDAPGRLDFNRDFYRRVAEAVERRRLVHDHIVPIRSGYAWPVRAGSVVRIVAVEGPQVCDLNLWNLNNPRERFWAARTRQLQGAHVTTFDRLWSCLPYLRAMAPYHLTELDVHDVLNVFQVTGLDPVHEIYFMEPSPAKKGDFFEFFAEIDLLCAISTCPSGDLSRWGWGADGADPVANCHPLGVEVYELSVELLEGWKEPEPVRIKSSVYG